MGSVQITHPFHPQSNKRFKVLKVKKQGGTSILSLLDPEKGSFAIQADWTDYLSSKPPVSNDLDGYISSKALIGLCEMVKNVNK